MSARKTLIASLAVLVASFFPASTALAGTAAEFGVEPGSLSAGSYAGEGVGPFAPLAVGASEDPRAGGHPFQIATSFSLTTHTVGTGFLPDAALKDVVVDLPPGLVGNPLATPRCKQETLVQQGFCPNEDAVGLIYIELNAAPFGTFGPNPEPGLSFSLPIFNLEPAFGEPALLGFLIPEPSFVVLIHLHLDPQRNYAVTASVPNISGLATLYSSKIAIWGEPAVAAHDKWRGYANVQKGPGCLNRGGTPTSLGSCPSEAPLKPFLSNPTSCTGQPVDTTIHIDSWEEPGALDENGFPDLSDGAWRSAVAESHPVEGCADVPFGPTLEGRPSTDVADSPTGLKVDLHVPQNEEPEGLATADLKDAKVTLPEGLVVNPSSANGLAACSSSQIGLTTSVGESPVRFDGRPAECPDASKIGRVEVDTPLIDHPLPGAVYLARQEENPFGSLLAIYITVDDPQTGTVIKLAGHVEANPVTGQLTTTVAESPQLPFEDFKLEFFKGAGAPLRTPPTCATYSTDSVLTPWSAPQGSPVSYSDRYAIGRSPTGGPCPSSPAGQPNAPAFEAGTESPLSAAYSPMVIRLRREDGSQEFDKLTLTPPPGLLARLAGIPYCPDAALAAAAGNTGREEEAHPSCPAASEVGTVKVAAGAGPAPYWAAGTAYLAGPYKGAPLSLAIVTPAVAGPFDLGTVVVRTALQVDPETARITAVSDPIPHILRGIPLDVRQIVVHLDHPGWGLNPSSCEAMSFGGVEESVLGASAPLSNRFQVGECGRLRFKPRLKLRLKGATKRTGHPALKAVVTYPEKGVYSNIARAQVNLPHAEFLDQGNIDKACTKPVLLAGDCPASSVYGQAKAWTPLLERPLEGPVYLVGGYGYKLPALVAELDGQIRVLLVGKVDSGKNRGIRNTFEVVPDAPVSRFELSMKGGKKYGLLENSENLCKASKAKRRAIVRFTAQNGKVDQYKPVVANQCGKKKGKKHAGHGRGHQQSHR